MPQEYERFKGEWLQSDFPAWVAQRKPGIDYYRSLTGAPQGSRACRACWPQGAVPGCAAVGWDRWGPRGCALPSVLPLILRPRPWPAGNRKRHTAPHQRR